MTEDAKIKAGNINTFKELYNDFYIPLCLFAERYTEDSETAADIVQETFIKLWQRHNDFTFLHQIRSFLYTTVRNNALNELEHRKVEGKYADHIQIKSEETFFQDHVIEEETYRLLITSIEKLPGQTCKVMKLALEGKNNKEIAEELNIADGTVHTLKKIAYKRLRDDLKNYFYLLTPFFF